MFTFLSEVGRRGGGTLVISGSHRLVERFVSRLASEEGHQKVAVLRERLKVSDSWIKLLTKTEARATYRAGYFVEETYARLSPSMDDEPTK